MESWNKTQALPDNNRFVVLTLQDGREVKAKWDNAPSNIFRPGKQWLDINNKFRATNMNPAMSWREI